MWKNRLKIADGEVLRLDSKYEKGNLGQEEVALYSIVDAQGKITGSVQYTDHTSIKAPFHQSLHLVQRDESGKTIIDERWTG
jgi:hypothetical protein